VNRVYNFSSGPAVLPLPVLEEIQRDMMALPGVGMSILEISHRSAAFEAILAQAEADVRASRASRRTTRCCSSRAARARSSRWCR
jgi:Phosphoserine aminotransferase